MCLICQGFVFLLYISAAIYLRLIHIAQNNNCFVPYICIIFRLVLCLISVIIKLSKGKQSKTKARKNNMKNYKITDKATKAIIGVVAMTPAQARKVEKDFIVKEA